MSDPIQPIPKKRFTKFKLFFYLLALVGVGWLGIQAYWGFFKFRIWLAGFGSGAFWVLGLIAGFIYFHSVHRIHRTHQGNAARRRKSWGLYVGFSLGLVVIEPLPWSLALRYFFPPGDLKIWSLVLHRMFRCHRNRDRVGTAVRQRKSQNQIPKL